MRCEPAATPSSPRPAAARASPPPTASHCQFRRAAPRDEFVQDAPTIAAALEPQAPPITGSATPNAPVKDRQTTTSVIHLDNETAVSKLRLDLDITHPYRGDLAVSLTSPSGKTVMVWDRTGGSDDDIKQSFELGAQFQGEQVKGDWTLSVQDTASGDEGMFNGWGMEIAGGGTPPPPPPPPPEDDNDPMRHIEILSADSMKGRDSPSEGLDTASRYVQGLMQKYGVEPANTGAANPYEQPFDLWGFNGVQEDDRNAGIHRDASNWGLTQFEHGFFLDDTLSKEDLQILSDEYNESGAGIAPVRFNSVDDVKQVASLQDGKVRNTVGVMRGTGPHKDEYIVVMAHLDHVGVDRSGRVYNGADDNASGSSVNLSIMPQLQRLQAEGKLDRSVLFVFTGAEEKGLVGSTYLVNHPLPGIPNEKIAGVINQDMVGRWDAERLSVGETGRTGTPSYFRELINEANRNLSNPFDNVNRDIDQYKDRNDAWPWMRKNIPSVFIFEGLSRATGGGEIIPEYHRPEDDAALIWRDSNGEKPRHVRDLVLSVVLAASNRQAAAAPEALAAA